MDTGILVPKNKEDRQGTNTPGNQNEIKHNDGILDEPYLMLSLG